MQVDFYLSGNDIVLEPPSGKLYDTDAPGFRDHVKAMAQTRANETGKPVEVFVMSQWSFDLGDVVFTALPEKTP